MQQRFNLQPFQNTIADDALILGVKPCVLNDITIEVIADIEMGIKPYLWLNYQIRLPKTLLALLDWSDWQEENVAFTDFLWQQTCLECFIQCSKQSGYIEINAAPSGEFAVYEFLAYRTPSQLPPVPLFLKDKFQGDHRAVIIWQNSNDLHHAATIFQRRFAIDLSQIATVDLASANFGLSKLQPCVILTFGSHQLYFASEHPALPDFHNASFWQPFCPAPKS